MQISSLFYLGAILLVIGLRHEPVAQLIVRRFERQRTGATDGLVEPTSTLAGGRRSRRRGCRTGSRRPRALAALGASPCSRSSSGRSRARCGAALVGFLTEDLPLFGQPGRDRPADRRLGDPRRHRDADRAAGRRADRDLHDEFAAAELGRRSSCDRPDERPALDRASAIFVFGLLVYGHTQNGLAGAYGLAIVMLPLITRATQEVLRLVPAASAKARSRSGEPLAHGARRGPAERARRHPHRTVLAVARAAGETAPLLFVDVDLREHRSSGIRARAAEHAGADLHLVGVADPTTTSAPGRPRSC
jgi:phosphate transport system permease protein